MVDYIKWMALEYLSPVSDYNAANPESLGALRMSIRDAEREKRLALVREAPVDKRACEKFLKIFDHMKHRREFEYFRR